MRVRIHHLAFASSLLAAALAAPAHAQAQRADFATGLYEPLGITQLADGRILVTEPDSNRVSVLSSSGVRSDFATGLVYPTGLTQLADGRILVTEWGAGRVSELNTTTGTRSDFATGLVYPTVITQLADGRILVVEHDRVSVLSSTGARSDFATELPPTHDLTQLADGRILAVEDDRVSVLSSTGARSDFATELDSPTGVTQLADGRILVTEHDSHRVSVLSNSGVRSDFAIGLDTPMCITQLADGRILVSEGGALRGIDRVSVLEESPTQAGLPTAPPPAAAPPRYELVRTPRSFAEAEADAVARGGHLASIADADDNEAVVAAAYGWYVWIGLTDQDDSSTEGSFVWTDGTPGAYTNWAAGEPNDYNNEDCALMTSEGSWVDIACDGAQAYIVEIPAGTH